ncbi:MAG: hypothetical protein US83_C0004G0003 [Candidatus Falkowbacteria bacterium GW2011_GWC2_38_22]|uniref:DUF11 domain-containing protein n=1 Tax=Candidatus Falkowbacteria bacterium GW2011_GWE1_38_31 TaxID=1618638 RepID=A0A0G0MA76_9BACT|nr:MAG: hypothetical protein US73_C0002G0114 [Candidatus Falkowbacteria bacterium GW2011_GWF2_38_1205]KKQ61619.1 MAG: hypothetical protein US83_C0004G0003 [Candidatus Falkowbacteria bacterium GW2011_GWC2_38_22]KKQ63766.1 MAG: hypothetical protein US84_C0004G0114 [Candidatus Falkowbacteria bacterium GW2011_GWF1_38_22]KKQ65818.1 MAG: hypothetical protein US87_C0004G0003 [Candidatus Falkowbacteria bacterium GW2011_GWE2_38_254]KKQ70629.1 MAG: hypothetical protein US91_C0004G0114 [Candidatus Falkowb
MIINKNNIILSLVLSLLIFLFPNPTNAQTPDILEVTFENGNGLPLFNEASFLPGDAVTRWVEVKNLSANKQAAAVRSLETENDYDLDDWMTIEIDDDNNPATAPFYTATLSDFFALPSLHLGDINAGATVYYYFSITLSLNTPNAMQEKGIMFDLIVAEGNLESPVPDPHPQKPQKKPGKREILRPMISKLLSMPKAIKSYFPKEQTKISKLWHSVMGRFANR